MHIQLLFQRRPFWLVATECLLPRRQYGFFFSVAGLGENLMVPSVKPF